MSRRVELQPQYGNWTVIEEAPPRPNKKGHGIRHIRVRCACGTEKIVGLSSLRQGTSRGCRDCSLVRHHPTVGTVFGDLTLIKSGIKMPGRNSRRVEVRCICGEEKFVLPAHLVSGAIKSCGCRKRRRGSAHPKYTGHEEISGSHFRHMEDMARKRGILFKVTIQYLWNLYIQQNRKCALTGAPLDMWPKKDRTASLDRIDSKLPYRKGNLQWVHKAVNMMKGSLDQAVFINLCESVASYRKDLV